jgi:5-formyltetrahydrofolate cyclo-ligase
MPQPASDAKRRHVDLPEKELRRGAKALMRRRFRSRRAGLPANAVAERSAAIVERLMAHETVAAARAVALFWPIERHKEVDLRQVDARLRERGCAVAYPEIDPQTDVMTFRLATPDAMLATAMGFLAPPPSAPEAPSLDVVVVPGIAFDPQGYRIGYGAGYYDRALPRYCPPAVPIGVAFDFQLATDLPRTEHDVPVACIVTDRRRLDVPSARG